MLAHLLVLNHNGRALLAECLPSVIAAARESRYECNVLVVDNNSRDGSVPWLAEQYPEVRVIHCANRGLCSFNAVVAGLPGPVAILLNNDIKLDRRAVDYLVEPLIEPASDCFMTAPRCCRFDGTTYEGFKTAVRWRWGLVQATALFPGHEEAMRTASATASAGAALAVRRDLFTGLGGFDSLYLPGRIEDLDLCYRAFAAGYQARYVPEAVVYHRGMASFGPAFGADGCDHLALRNTLLFQWKNLRHPSHRLRQVSGCAIRVAAEAVRSPWASKGRRWRFTRALREASARWRTQGRPRSVPANGREREFFRRFHPSEMVGARRHQVIKGVDESTRTRRHPISHWYLQPLAAHLAEILYGTPIRPTHVTLCGLALAALAAAIVLLHPSMMALAGTLVLAAWLCDRTDGLLARRQGTATARGAWLDANIDELVDVGLHAATASVASAATQSMLPWMLLAAFLGGKYLFMHGVNGKPATGGGKPSQESGWLRKLYHLPGDADVRVHLLVLALFSGWLTAELAVVAAYYNLRWIARYALVALRRGATP
jgi:GT2 family glycosyltransferase/phosphatidylglycerophosphate synthase